MDGQDTVELEFYREDGNSRLPLEEGFDTLYATQPEAIYEFWALLVSSIGLGIIALEKVMQVIRLFLPI